MDFKKEIMDALELIKLNAKVIPKIVKNKEGLAAALIIAALAGVAYGIGTLNIPGIILGAIWMIVGLFIGTAIIYAIAFLFGGKAKFMDLLKPIGYMYIIMWIAVIPLIGPVIAGIAGIWSIVVEVVIVKNIYKFSTGKAAAVVLIPVAIALIIGIIIAVVAGMAIFAAFSQTNMAALG